MAVKNARLNKLRDVKMIHIWVDFGVRRETVEIVISDGTSGEKEGVKQIK